MWCIYVKYHTMEKTIASSSFVLVINLLLVSISVAITTQRCILTDAFQSGSVSGAARATKQSMGRRTPGWVGMLIGTSKSLACAARRSSTAQPKTLKSTWRPSKQAAKVHFIVVIQENIVPEFNFSFQMVLCKCMQGPHLNAHIRARVDITCRIDGGVAPMEAPRVIATAHAEPNRIIRQDHRSKTD